MATTPVRVTSSPDSDNRLGRWSCGCFTTPRQPQKVLMPQIALLFKISTSNSLVVITVIRVRVPGPTRPCRKALHGHGFTRGLLQHAFRVSCFLLVDLSLIATQFCGSQPPVQVQLSAHAAGGQDTGAVWLNLVVQDSNSGIV